MRERRIASAPVTVYLRFEHAPPPELVPQISAELDTVLAPAGIRLDCRLLDDSGQSEVSAELVVVSLRGFCQSGVPGTRWTRTTPLGWTHISDGVILPFCAVDCDRIRDFITPCLRQEIQPCNHLFCRAIARVVAHELYHIFADTTQHGIHGIAKSSLTAAELVVKHLRFHSQDLLRLRQRKLRRLFVVPDSLLAENFETKRKGPGERARDEQPPPAAGGR
jgi:hypothetical protein